MSPAFKVVMSITIREHSIKGWQALAASASFVPDPMILRTGEVFVNGLDAASPLRRPDFDVLAALKENIGGLSDFFDLVVTRERIPLIDYRTTFDMDSLAKPLEQLLGAKALPIFIEDGPYGIVKQGAFNSLKQIRLDQIQAFGNQLRELDSLRYDWQPKLEDYRGDESWLSHVDQLDEGTSRAARFLLGGFIFSGFAQASGTEHYIQPKRSRFFLSLTATAMPIGQIGHDVEEPIFEEALKGLNGTSATVRRLDGLPPVLPYLIDKAPDNVTAADLLKRALDFPETADGRRYCDAAALLRKEGVAAQRTQDAASAAHAEALRMLKPYSRLADHDGGFEVEASLGLDGPSMAVSKTLHAPAWLQIWWNDQTPFGGLRKTFRRMWMAKESYQNLEKQVHDIWARS
jgi:hypothetical protein